MGWVGVLWNGTLYVLDIVSMLSMWADRLGSSLVSVFLSYMINVGNGRTQCELLSYQTSPSVKVTVILLEWILSVDALIYIVLEGL